MDIYALSKNKTPTPKHFVRVGTHVARASNLSSAWEVMWLGPQTYLPPAEVMLGRACTALPTTKVMLGAVNAGAPTSHSLSTPYLNPTFADVRKPTLNLL